MQVDKQSCARDFTDAETTDPSIVSTQVAAVGQGAVPTIVDSALLTQTQKDKRLYRAIRAGRADEMTAWIKAGADVNATYDKGKSALLVAIAHKIELLECVKVLVDLLTPDEIERMCPRGLTAVSLAAHVGHAEIVTLLADKLKSAEAINRPRGDGYSPLILAVQTNHIKAVEVLVSRLSSSQINEVSPSGHTALMYAAARGYDQTVRVLISKLSRAEINQRSFHGDDALTIAIKKGHHKTTNVLINKLKDLEAINRSRLVVEQELKLAMEQQNHDRVMELKSLL